jgi:ADP-ribose pyrophosphatase YjhB (NUDIX family)
VAAGTLFLDDAGRVLLVRPTYKPDWDIPGGYVESGESPRDACVREIYEELGLRVEVGRLLSVDWAPHPDEGDKVLFIFDGGRLGPDQLDAINFRDGEVAEYTFLHEVQIDVQAIPRLARRIRASLGAMSGEQMAYLEHGDVKARP